ncbi:transketolase [Rickettsiella endosymbiont of Litargus connexus]|jgi:transketolase|uniref:transketolase n=1 Tax=Rickettsiella endosymbiont of Litargus connexus TaxID=3066237 RepID=UPI0027F14B5E|nr:transketolase [Gammaproteobacteria bacterium]MCH9755189.1 transketolase [Gammaproteobacteria bacterium]MDD5161336.1 transketolase [Candidatus Rickettsiella isopodorum]MDQ5900118.1 transketolase [Pseudomonadota bacterium]
MSYQKKYADAIRFLSMDAVEKANSGHPGMPMGMADIATVLWREFLVHNPDNPNWSNRDRFILSNGHGSMLHYALLHLTGYDLPLAEIKRFRQLHSKTPGHPEVGLTPGIETTTGPLGQGFANAVGMALAEKNLAARFNRPSHSVIDHFTYVFLGDGCLMEGISHEVASLAGCLGLGKLIAFWDDNNISIDGDVSDWFKDNTPERFKAYHWHVIPDIDGHDPQQIKLSIEKARAITDKPSLLCCKTKIACGAPNLMGSHQAHGAALGEKEIAATRLALHWDYPPFEIPEDIYQAWDARSKGNALEKAWEEKWSAYQSEFSELAKEYERRINKKLPLNWEGKTKKILEKIYQNLPEKIATRKASQNTLNAFAPLLPELLGGSADLTESNSTFWKGSQVLTKENPAGNYLHYGVREFGMSAMMNGIALHGGFIPYGGTFLVFSDYARNAVRLSALMKQHVIFIYTHDSIGLGEDGPTHQPIEHINSLRLIPNLSVWRPCDALETAVAWQQAIQHLGPTCLLLTRQAIPPQTHSQETLQSIHRGAYILLDSPSTTPEAIIIATGSEVNLAISAAQSLNQQGREIRVVSMPSADRFEQQDFSYKAKILPNSITLRIAIEAGNKDFWYRYVGSKGKVIGVSQFGESAPGSDVFKNFGFTVENIIKILNPLLAD